MFRMTVMKVALKVINVDDIEEAYVSRNLTREARILRDLHHPNIVHLYETVKTHNLYCLSLELIRGVNLGMYLQRQEDCRLSEKGARVFFYQMLSAVDYMHRLNIIHRGVILYTMVVGKMPFAFSREPSDNPESSHKREQFVQRISKGLMQENWELMEDLSPDCWNLLHDLLQPDQFRRIRIEDARHHQWITKDAFLKKRLPQNRRDIRQKFYSEVIFE